MLWLISPTISMFPRVKNNYKCDKKKVAALYHRALLWIEDMLLEIHLNKGSENPTNGWNVLKWFNADVCHLFSLFILSQ